VSETLPKPLDQAVQAPADQVGLSLVEQAAMVSKTGIVPDYLRGKPEWCMAIALKGRELGFGLMASLEMLYYVKGKVGMAAQGMCALAKSRVPGCDVAASDWNAEACTVTASRPGMKDIVVTKTMKDLRARGVANTPAYDKYPENMLFWRAAADACRFQFPDVLAGVYTAEELGEDVDDEGRPIMSVEAAEVTDSTPEPVKPDEGEVKAAADMLTSALEKMNVAGLPGDAVIQTALDSVKGDNVQAVNVLGTLRRCLIARSKEHWETICNLWIASQEEGGAGEAAYQEWMTEHGYQELYEGR